MNTKNLINNLTKDNNMSEDQGMQGDLERIDEDELYIRNYIYTFGTRYVNNFWAIKFAAPIDLSNGETAAGIGFHGKDEEEKKPVKIHLRYKETATAIGMSCPKENNGGPWVLLDCDSSKCGAPEIELSQLVDSDKFKCCDQLHLGDAGEFDWENKGPMEKEPEEGQRMTVIPHAEKARSTAESVVRVSKEGQLDQELVQRIAGAITEAALKGQMSCILKYEKWDKAFNEKVDDIEAYLMLGMGYMGRKYIDTNNTLVLEIEWK